MAQMLAGPHLKPGSHLLLDGIAWSVYSQFLRMFAESPGVRMTYDRGELEIMSPLLQHDFESRFLGDLVETLTQERNLTLMKGGSATLRRKLEKRGLEPDECFWIANAHRMAGKLRLDLRTDPPPDLAIEVEVTRSLLDRMSIYAKLRVPEVWHLRKYVLTYHVLTPKGKYRKTKSSPTFPGIAPGLLTGFLKRVLTAGDQNALLREFRERIRQIDSQN